MTRLEDHRAYLADRARVVAYEQAIASLVRPGSIVADVGSGTGILGLMACRAGARRVYAIEPSGVINIARDIARANGCADRLTFINASASEATLPEMCDVVLSDFIGHFGYDAGLFETARAFRRFLRNGGVSIPSTITFVVAPTDSEAAATTVDSWRAPVAGFDVASVAATAANTPVTEFTDADGLLSTDSVCAAADVLEAPGVIRIAGTVRASRSGRIRGLAAWFRATLAPGVEMTNAPDAAVSIRRRNMILPIAEPITVEAGDSVRLDLTMRPHDLVIDWCVAAHGRTARQSSFRGLFIRDADLRRGAP